MVVVACTPSTSIPGDPSGRTWSAAPRGVEDWSAISAPLARRGRPLERWDIRGRALSIEPDGTLCLSDPAGRGTCVRADTAFAASGDVLQPRLEIRDDRLELWLDADDQDVLVDPAWTPLPSMDAPRAGHAATYLQNNYDERILVSGGRDEGSILATTLSFSPGDLVWAAEPPMAQPRTDHLAVALDDYRVLVAGGMTPDGCTATAEIFDLRTHAWTIAASMSVARCDMAYASLRVGLVNPGAVMVVGGFDGTSDLASSEIYDPTSNTWTAGPTSSVAAHGRRAAFDDVMLIAGGVQNDGGPIDTVEIYDPKQGTLAAAPPLPEGRYLHTVTSDEESFYVAGGRTLASAATTSVLRLSLGGSGWSTMPELVRARAGHAAVINGDTMLFVGGTGLDGAVEPTSEGHGIVVPGVGPLDPMGVARRSSAVVELPRAEVAVAVGGVGADALATAAAEEFVGRIANGEACISNDDCRSDACLEGVCCDPGCDVTGCHTCLKSRGAPYDGTCAPAHEACDDGNVCTVRDACMSGGICAGDPRCSPQCYRPGITVDPCDPSTGACGEEERWPDGTECFYDGRDHCVATGVCSAGECVAATPVDCGHSLDGTCRMFDCDPAKGCIWVPRPDGERCDLNGAIQGVCQGEVCVAATAGGAGGTGGTGESGGDGAAGSDAVGGQAGAPAGGAGGASGAGASDGGGGSAGSEAGASSGGVGGVPGDGGAAGEAGNGSLPGGAPASGSGGASPAGASAGGHTTSHGGAGAGGHAAGHGGSGQAGHALDAGPAGAEPAGSGGAAGAAPGGSPSAAGSGHPAGQAGVTDIERFPAPADADSGCSIPADGAGDALLFGLGALLVRRRRRAR